jgi:hypothetical protein
MKCVAMAIASLAFVAPACAQKYFKTGAELVRECASPEPFLRGACSGYIVGQIDALEGGRYTQGKGSCLTGSPSVEEIVAMFTGVLRANDAYASDLPASVSIANIYRANCANPN